MIDWQSIWPDVIEWGLFGRIYFARPVFTVLMLVSAINLAVGIRRKRPWATLSYITFSLIVSIYFVYVSHLYAMTYQTFTLGGLSAGPLYAIADIVAAIAALGYIIHTVISWGRHTQTMRGRATK